MENLVIDTRTTSVGDLMALNMLIYVNLCKFLQIRWVCGILKSPLTKSTGYQPGWIHKITLSESVSKRLNLCRNSTFLCRNCIVSKLPVSLDT